MEFKRHVGAGGILFASIGAMIGSGWLFSSLYAAQAAGPSAIISWVIAGFFIIVIALTFAELGTLFPIAGGIANYPFFTHGRFLGFLLGWISWLSFVVIPPIEVQAAIQYGSNFLPFLIERKEGGTHELTMYGYAAAALLMWVLVYINNLGVKFMSETNKFFSIWKILVPAIAIGLFFYHSKSFTSLVANSPGGFAPFGWHGILSALALTGVVFSFNGFQVGILMAAETKDPQRNIPKAIIGAVLVGMILYGLLQLSFLVAIPHDALKGGWALLKFPGDAGPLAGLSVALGATWVAALLYVDAVVAPLGSGLVFVASTSRLLYALGANGFVPAVNKLNKKGIPETSIWINFIVGMAMFLPFPGWQSMVSFLSSIMIASYAIVPVCLVALRKNLPNIERPFRLPFYKPLCLFAFYICNLMLYWSGWDILCKLLISVMVGSVLYLVYAFAKKEMSKQIPELIASSWLFIYFFCFAIISKLGTYGGGLGKISEGIDFAVIAVFSIVVFKISQMTIISKEATEKNVVKIIPEYQGKT